MNNLVKLYPVTASVSIATLILFICSSLRHWLYHSHALDLGFFDQGLYLISIAQTPIVSFSGFHTLGDHAAVILYPLALFYRIYPDIHWLFIFQAIALTIGGFPIYYLALHSKIDRHRAITIVFTYLLYPIILNKSLFDFHPDAIALPGFLFAVLAARMNRVILLIVSVTVILSCKSVLSLTVISMGIWLILFENRKIHGAIALSMGLGWFIVSTQSIIPVFLGKDMGGVTAALASRYSYLGNSFFEIIKNILIKPNLVLSKVFSLDTLEYVFYLILPIAWGLSPKYLLPLISSIPALAINILSTVAIQRNLVHHYALPILPFLFIAVIGAVSKELNWLKTRRNILIWSAIAFILLGKISYLGSYFITWDTQKATAIAISKVQDSGALLVTGEIAPHLTHRPIVKLAANGAESIDLQEFKYILLNQKHPGWNSSVDLIQKLRSRTEASGSFKLEYQRDEVYLFVQNSN
jgi:uncharacterized membrane protein